MNWGWQKIVQTLLIAKEYGELLLFLSLIRYDDGVAPPTVY